MAIRALVGIPRSGKTYYMVEYLESYYFTKNKDGEYILKTEFENVTIVSNIKGLKLPHHDLLEWIEKAGGSDKLFTLEFQEKIEKKYPVIVYVIDECHKYFPPKLNIEPIFHWFSEHGQMGQDIWLMTQVHDNMSNRIFKMAELEIRTVPQSFSLSGGKELKYNEYVRGMKVNTTPIIRIKKQKIFKLYKSHKNKSPHSIKNPLTSLAIVTIIVALYLIYSFYNYITGFAHRSDDQKNETTIEQTQNQPQIQPRFTNKKNTTKRTKASYITYKDHIIVLIGNSSWPLNHFPHDLQVDGFNNLYTMLTETEINDYFPDHNQSDVRRSRKSGGKEQQR